MMDVKRWTAFLVHNALRVRQKGKYFPLCCGIQSCIHVNTPCHTRNVFNTFRPRALSSRVHSTLGIRWELILAI